VGSVVSGEKLAAVRWPGMAAFSFYLRFHGIESSAINVFAHYKSNFGLSAAIQRLRSTPWGRCGALKARIGTRLVASRLDGRARCESVLWHS
jgi:hypothetical protein